MECFTKCGWRRPAVSEARTYVKNTLKVLGGKAVEDPALNLRSKVFASTG